MLIEQEGNYIHDLQKEFKIFNFNEWKFSSMLPGPYHTKDCFNELDDDRQEVRILMKSKIGKSKLRHFWRFIYLSPAQYFSMNSMQPTDSTKEIEYEKFDEIIRFVLFKEIFAAIPISALRISDMNLKFSEDLIVAHVAFLKKPPPESECKIYEFREYF